MVRTVYAILELSEYVVMDYLALNPSINPLPINKWQAGIFNWSW